MQYTEHSINLSLDRYLDTLVDLVPVLLRECKIGSANTDYRAIAASRGSGDACVRNLVNLLPIYYACDYIDCFRTYRLNAKERCTGANIITRTFTDEMILLGYSYERNIRNNRNSQEADTYK